MSAHTTVRDVLRWAAAPKGSPPSGDLNGIESLSKPDGELRNALGDLCVLTASRLRLGNPPLNDPVPPGCVSLLLAALVGAAGNASLPSGMIDVLMKIIENEPVATHPSEWIARHGVVVFAVASLPSEASRTCGIVSPLTGLLRVPVQGKEAQARRLADDLRKHQLGNKALVQLFAEPSDEPAIRNWRADLLDAWRVGSPQEVDFVLSVYEMMMLHHPTRALAQVAAASRTLSDPLAAKDEAGLLDAISVARWWKALADIDRTMPDRLREHHLLGYSYREGVRLHNLSHRLQISVS